MIDTLPEIGGFVEFEIISEREDSSRSELQNELDLFEKYQVDLVIGGHEHVYIRKNNLYKNNKDFILDLAYQCIKNGKNFM